MGSTFLGDVVRILTGNALLLLFTTLSNVLIARGLGPHGQGTVAALMVFPLLFMTVAEMGVRQATVRAVPRTENHDQLVGAVVALLIISSIAGVVVCGALMTVQRPRGTGWQLAGLALLLIPLKLASSYGGGFLLGKQRIATFSRLAWAGEAGRAGFVVLLVWIAQMGIAGALLATVAGAALAAVSTGLVVAKHARIRFRWSGSEARSLLSVGSMYAVSLFMLQLNHQAHIIALTHLAGVKQVGIFTLAANLAMLLWRLPDAAGVVIFARSASTADPRAFSLKVARAARVSFAIVLFAALVVYFSADVLIRVVLGPAYDGTASVLRMMLPGIVAFTVFRVMNMDLAGRGRPHLALYATCPALLLATFLNFLLVPGMGALGAAIASSSSLSFAATVMIVVFARETRLKIGDVFTGTSENQLSMKLPGLKPQ